MQQTTEKIKLSRSELGRLGAAAINGDPVKKRASVIKGWETRKRNKLLAKLDELTKEQQLKEYEKLSINEEQKKTREPQL